MDPSSIVVKVPTSVWVYASDGPAGKEIQVSTESAPQRAYDAIDRRMRFSSINVLPVGGTVREHGEKAKCLSEAQRCGPDADSGV